MWIILLINLLIASIIAYLGLKKRQEKFRWYNAGIVFIAFGGILLIGSVPVINDFEEAAPLQFIGVILAALGIISLIIGFVTKANKDISLSSLAIAIETAAVCLVYLTHNSALNLTNLIVPEFALIVGLILFIVSKRKMK